LTGKPLSGYLNRMRRNLASLDESIENVRKASKGEKPSDKRARLKLLRDLIELQNVSLLAVKTHLLGRDETGAANEPQDVYDDNPQVEFERYFKNQLSLWTQDDLKLKCEDCGVESEGVSNRRFVYAYPKSNEYYDLCEKCYGKRTTESNGESSVVKDVPQPASKADIRVILQAAGLQIKTLKLLPLVQRIVELEKLLAENPTVAPGMEPALEAYREVLQKELDEAKAAAPHQ